MKDKDRTATRSKVGGTASATILALRPKEAAAALGISPRKLWEITASQTSSIPHCRFGRVVIYPVVELKEWLAAKAKGKGGAE